MAEQEASPKFASVVVPPAGNMLPLVRTAYASGDTLAAPAQLVQRSLDLAQVAYYPFETVRPILDRELRLTKRPSPTEVPPKELVSWNKQAAFKANPANNAVASPPSLPSMCAIR